MTSPLQRRWIATAVASTLIGLSLPGMAQPMPMAPDRHEAGQTQHQHQHDHAERSDRMKARMAERHVQLRQKLQLSPAQEPAWQAFVQGMQPPAARYPGQEGWRDLSTPERLDRMEKLKAERDQAMAQRHQAIRRFYAQLTPDQQKTFDTEALTGMRHAGMRGAAQGQTHKHSHPNL